MILFLVILQLLVTVAYSNVYRASSILEFEQSLMSLFVSRYVHLVRLLFKRIDRYTVWLQLEYNGEDL